MFEAIISGYRWFFLRLADVVGIGWGIVALSVITSAAMMPLMKAVAGIVKREADYQSVILPQLAEIKKRFSSDAERHLHIQRLYARYCYSPLSAVKKVLPLFVQIPFLLLTYYMLKNTPQLGGVSFLFLDDLGQPDALLKTVGKIHLGLNVLPIVMTLVNMLTVAATPGFTHRDQVQAVGISLLFLVLLYTAPSALLLYWTLNNVITMIRTLAAKRGEGARLLYVRVSLLRCAPVVVRRVATTKTLSYVSMSLLLLTLYFRFTAWFMFDYEGGISVNIMYRGMVFMLAATAIVGVFHLHENTSVRKWILYPSAIICCSPAVVLAILFCTTRTKFMWVMERINLFDVVLSLLAICVCPYVFRSGVSLSRVLVGFLRTLKSEWPLLVIPVALAMHYSYSSETFILPFGSVVILCAYMILLPITCAVILMLLFGDWISMIVLFRVSLGVCVGIYVIPMISYGTGLFAYNNNLPVRLLIMVSFAWFLTCLRNRKGVFIFGAILFCAAIVNSVARHGKDMVNTLGAEEHEMWRARMTSVIGETHCVKSNNVYLLIYDSYGHRSILDGLGIQDDSIYEDLAKHGFTVYDAYSTGASTLHSMSAFFSFAGAPCERSGIAGDNVFSDFLLDGGYSTYYLLCGYLMPKRGARKPGTYYFPGEKDITRPEMVLFPCVLRGTLSQSPAVFNEYTLDEWISEKRRTMKNVGRSHSFIYAHMGLPDHAPWFPRDRKTDMEEQAMYKTRLNRANIEMRKDLAIVDKDPDAIVIIASDHGGSLLIPEHYGAWDLRNLVDHFGILLAIRWPKDYKPTIRLNCLQDVPVEVMSYLSGDKSITRLIPDRSTLSLSYPIEAPAGLIKNGVIQSGPHKGENFFTAAYQIFGKK